MRKRNNIQLSTTNERTREKHKTTHESDGDAQLMKCKRNYNDAEWRKEN